MILQDSTPEKDYSLSIKLIERASEFVLELLHESLSPAFVFHNQRYTVQTVHAISLISKAEEIGLQDQIILKMAAWFHHTGLIETSDSHRSVSVRLATDFLERYDVDPLTIEKVANIILHSASAWDVTSLLDMILYDADWYFLAASNYKEMLERRKEEIIMIDGGLNDQRWSAFIDDCFVQHQYLTNYGQEFLHNRRRTNYLNYKQNSHLQINREIFEPRSNF